MTSPKNQENILKKLKDPATRDDGFRLLTNTYHKPIYWLIRRLVTGHEDANDLVQDVFIKIWKGLDNFRGDSQLSTWIYRIATNEALSFIKSKKGKYTVAWQENESKFSEMLEDDGYFTGDEVEIKLQKAIQLLPAKQKIVFSMKYFDELKYEEISAILDTSVGALKASYHHAVRKIEDYITSH